MAVLVTGGAGYIGSHMVLALAAAGERPVVLDDLSTGFRSAVPHGVPLVRGDVGDGALLDRLFGEHPIDAVIHFAARTVVPESMADPLGYYLAIAANTRTLIEAAVRHGVPHFVLSSTAAVYGNPVASPVREDAAPAPLSPYGSAKLMAEWMLRDASAAHGLRHVALRYFNVAGADPDGRAGQSTANATHLIKVAVQAALGQRPAMQVFGTDYDTRDGSCIRDFIHVSDLATAHMAALAHLRGGGESLTLNCGYGRGYTVLEVVEAVRRVAGRPLPVETAPRRPGDIVSMVAATDRIRRTLGWRPRYDDLDVIVAHALAWERRLAGLSAA